MIEGHRLRFNGAWKAMKQIVDANSDGYGLQKIRSKLARKIATLIRPRQQLRADARRSAEFRAEGCAKVYCEKASGAQTDRAQLCRDIGQLAKGDLLMMTLDPRPPKYPCGDHQQMRGLSFAE
jgi:hypothetical protein